jgi:hypothetical protein
MLEMTDKRVEEAWKFRVEHEGAVVSELLFHELCERLDVPKDWDRGQATMSLPRWYQNSNWLREILRF